MGSGGSGPTGGGARQALKLVGVALLCVVYGIAGAGLLWRAGVPLIRSVLVAGVGAALTIAVAMLVHQRLRGRRSPALVTLTAVHLLGLVLVMGAVAMLPVLRVADFGDARGRVVAPDGRFEVVTYEFSAMIDPGWTLTIERADGGGREWFWYGVEGPAPVEVRFVEPTAIEVHDDHGRVWALTFDPDTLEPSDRYCTRPEYCWRWPFTQYTRTAPAP